MPKSRRRDAVTPTKVSSYKAAPLEDLTEYGRDFPLRTTKLLDALRAAGPDRLAGLPIPPEYAHFPPSPILVANYARRLDLFTTQRSPT